MQSTQTTPTEQKVINHQSTPNVQNEGEESVRGDWMLDSTRSWGIQQHAVLGV